jgi:hypothetical protein
MVAGTGLPIKDRAPTLLEPPPRAQISTAGNEMLGRAMQGFGETVTKIGEDRQKLEDARALADIRRGAIETGQNIANTFQTDHEGFDAAMRAYADKQMSSVNQRYVNAARDEIETVRLGMRDNIMRAADSQAKSLAHDAMKATLESAMSQVGASAYSGEDTRLAVHFEMLRKTLADGVASGQISPERMKLVLDEAEGHAESERIAGTSYKIYQKEGADGVRRALEKFKTDTTISMDMSKRERLEARVLTDMHQWEVRKNANVSMLDQDWESKKTAAKAGIASTSDLNSLRDAYLALGRPDKAREVNVYAQAVPYQRFMATKPIAVAETDLQRMRHQAALPDNPIAQRAAQLATEYGFKPQDVLGLINYESSFNPNAVSGQHEGLGQLSKKEREKYGAGKDPESQLRALMESLKDRKSEFVRLVGREPEAWEFYAAHQQGAAGFRALSEDPNRSAVAALRQFEGKPNEGKAIDKVRGNLPDNKKHLAETMSSGDFLAHQRSVYEKKRAEVAGGVDPELVKVLDDTLTERKKLIASDPMALVMKDPATPPQPTVDWFNKQAGIDALKERDATARANAQSWKVPEFPGLTKTEMDSLQERFDDVTTTTQQRLDMLEMVHKGMSAGNVTRTLAHLGKNRPELVLAGELAPTARSVAVKILSGDLPENKVHKAHDADFRDAVRASLTARYPGDPVRREQVSQAALNVYAVNMGQKGKAAARAVFDQDAAENALNEVAGETVIFNRKEIQAPERGMRQNDFERLLNQRFENGMPGAFVGRDGGIVPVDAATARKTTLMSAGGSRYLVFLGPFPVMQANGKDPYVLDLSPGRRIE